MSAFEKGALVLERFCVRFEAIIRQLSGTRAEEVACRRFFRNPKVKAKAILATAAAGTAVEAADHHVLIQDISEINYQDKADRKQGLGRVGTIRDGLARYHAIAEGFALAQPTGSTKAVGYFAGRRHIPARLRALIALIREQPPTPDRRPPGSQPSAE